MRTLSRVANRCVTVLALALTASSAWADPVSTPSSPSQLSALSVVTVPIALSEGVTTLSVQGVRVLGDGLELSVKGAGQVSAFSVRVPAAMVGGLSLAAGTVIEVTAEAFGHLLRASGKVIGFIPNELGRSLLHHAPIGHVEAPPRLQRTGRSL